MMRWSSVPLALLVAVVVVAGSAATVAGTPSSRDGSVPAARLVTDAIPVPSGALARALSPSTLITLTLTLTNSHAAELSAFLAEVENPESPQYHQFVTFPQFVARFAPSETQVGSVEAVLAAAGATDISATPDRSSVSGVLSAGAVETLLGVQLQEFGAMGGMPLYTATGPVDLPGSLVGLVAGIGGLSDESTALLDAQQTASAHDVRPIAATGGDFARDNTSGEYWYVGSDFTQLYHATSLFPGTGSVPNATYPTSVAVATLLVSSYNQSAGDDGNLPPFDPNVVDTYLNSTLGPGWPVSNVTGVPVTVGGVTPPLPGSFGALNDTSAYEVENSLDLEMVGSLAPGASLYNFYFGASVLTGSTTNGDAADYFAAELADALAYPYSPQHLVAVSCSFGLPDLDDAAWDAALITAAATGVTLVAASGDQGNAPDSDTGRSDGQWLVWPASDASEFSGALSAGGVSINVTGVPSSYFNGSSLNISYDANVGSLTNVQAWYDTTGGPGEYAGSEGGVSTVFSEPYWQFHSAAEPAIVNATILQGASSLGRAAPDLAMPANDTIATVAANSTRVVFFLVLEGTSIASPVIAGLIADIVAVANHNASSPWSSLGFMDPLLYQFGSYFAMHPGAASDPFLDVTVGSNYVFSAAAGWDPVTGWGEVSAPALLAALHNTTLLDYNYTGPTPGLPSNYTPSSPSSNIPWTIIFAILGAGVVAAVAMVALAARPNRPRGPPPSPPRGAWGGPEGMTAAPGATFLCPHCGAIRPAEPVRCPQCGAY